MRGLVLIVVFVSLLPLIFFQGPYIGILMWYWLSLMNPQKEIWGSVFTAVPYTMTVAIATLVSWLLYQSEPKLPPATKTTALIVILMLWVSLTSLLGIGPTDQIVEKWQLFEKMFLMTIVAYTLTTTRVRLDQLIVVCTFSIAFFGIKGGIYSIFTAGAYHVYGPSSTMIGDNNDLGVALTMTLPLLFYIRDRYRQPQLKWPMLALIGLTFIGDLFTYSRGALVALFSMGAMLWLRSRHKFQIMVLFAVAAVGVWHFAPPEWTERMGTIETYQKDASAETRLHMWSLAWAMAQKSPIVGSGVHWSYDPNKVNRLLRDSGLAPLTRARAPHSIWFEMLGDHGFVGLAIFLAILASAFLDARWLVRRSQHHPDLLWANNLGRMLQAALVGYCAGGSFATLAMYDGLYAVIIVAAAARRIVAAELASRETATAVGKGFIGLPRPGGVFKPQPTG